MSKTEEKESQLQAQTEGVKLSVPIDGLKKRLRPSTIRSIEQMLAGQAATVVDSDEELDKWLDKMFEGKIR